MADAVKVVIMAWWSVSEASLKFVLRDTYMESDTRQVDDLLPLRPVIRISRIRGWKGVKVDGAVSLDQIVAVFFGKDWHAVVKLDKRRH